MYEEIITFIKSIFDTDEFIPLHEPVFQGNEKKYLIDCIDSTFVSSVGEYVDRFEKMGSDYTGSKYAVATVNGTAALHICLRLAGVDDQSEVITQPLTFVATCNAISYCGARPVFVDVDRDTMGLSSESLKRFLARETTSKNGICVNKTTGRLIKAVLPMHTFGHPCRIDEIASICEEHNLVLIEDAAESLGSFYKDRHTGTFGTIAAISFNGNKTITTGGGGLIITDDENLAKRARHLTTTAKVAHPYEYIHDEVGYNYRLPNINAALGCAQMEQLDNILTVKRDLAGRYREFFDGLEMAFFSEPEDSRSNYWLNSLVFKTREDRDVFLKESNQSGVMCRPVWGLMNKLGMFKDCQAGDLLNSFWLEERVVNIPSGGCLGMDELILLGGGGHCKSCIDVIEQEGRYQVAGILDEKKRVGEKVLDYSIIGTDQDIKRYVSGGCYFLITIGQIGDSSVRQKVNNALRRNSARLATIVSPRAYVSRYAKIGQGTIIMHDALINASATIGENCIINTKALIEHDAVVEDFCHISTSAVVNGGATIREGSFFGSNAVSREGITCERNSFIKAGSTCKE